MTFREKLEKLTTGSGPVVKAFVAEASRLHEAEMAETRQIVDSIHDERWTAECNHARAWRDVQNELALADEEIALLNGALRIKTQECRQMEKLLGEKIAKFNVCRSEALSPSSQREEAKDAPDWKEFAVKPEPERCQCKSYVGDDHGHYGWTDSSRCPIHRADHPKGE